MKLVVYFFTMSSFLFFLGCFSSKESGSYQGDGKLTRLESPGLFGSSGWQIKFDDFSLSNKFNVDYSFSGLPQVDGLEEYKVYFYIPPSLHASLLSDAILEMVLFVNGNLVSSCNGPMRDWICSSFISNGAEFTNGDGLEKSYYCLKMKIPALPENQYTLKVKYTPPITISNDEIGYVYLSIGGYK